MTDRFPKRHDVEVGDVSDGSRQLDGISSRVHGTQGGRRCPMNVKRGEVVGIYGLMGAGRTELAMSIFGRSYGIGISGTLKASAARELHLKSPKKYREQDSLYVTEDRKGNGLVLQKFH